MDKLHSFLKEWVIGYLKNKDILEKRIEDIKPDEDGFDVVVKFNDKTQFFLIKPTIGNFDEIIEKIKNKGNVSLVVLNNRGNLDGVITNWDKLTEYKSFNVFFINPFSKMDKKWIISPYTHSKICDKGSLKSGLKSMFEMVEPINEERIKELIK